MGDITQIDPDEIEPVDIICAGSPCQGLSLAGKRKGLDDERSGLFRTAVDIVRRMRMCTGGKSPRFFVWENVPGAFSSNKGADFRSVLEEIGVCEIPIPPNGKWANAGMAELQECQIAWRVLDAQYWGVPQCRRRIFLVADFAADGRCAGEILFEREGVQGDSAKSKGAREAVAGGTADCARETVINYGLNVWDSIAFESPFLSECTPTMVRSKRLGVVTTIYDMTHADEVIRPVKDGIVPTLNARMGTGENQVPVVHAYCIAGNTSENLALSHSIVRRLTPMECERL